MYETNLAIGFPALAITTSLPSATCSRSLERLVLASKIFTCIALSKLARKCCEVKGRNLESEGLVLTAVGFTGRVGHDNLISISLSFF